MQTFPTSVLAPFRDESVEQQPTSRFAIPCPIVQYPQPKGIDGKLQELRKKSDRLTQAYLQVIIPVAELNELRAGIQREADHLMRIQRQNRGQDEAAMMQTARLIVKAAGKFLHCVDSRTRKDVILEVLSSITFKNKAITGYTLRPGALWASDQQCVDGLSISLDQPIGFGPAGSPVEAGTRKYRKCGETKPASQFYGNLTICSTPCRSAEERRRHLKRLQKLKSAKADSSQEDGKPT